MNVITRVFRLHWRQDARLFGIFWAIFAAMVGFVCLIMSLTDSDTYADMGCFVSLLSGLTILLLRFGLWQPYHFNLAVSMGQTRTAFMLTSAVHSALLTALFTVTLLLFGQIEQTLYPLLFPAATNEISLADIISPAPLAAIAAGLWLLTFVLSAAVTRYGHRAWWTLWAFWMFACLVLPRLLSGDNEDTSILGRTVARLTSAIAAALGTIAPAIWLILAVLAAAAVLAAGVHMYLHAEVRG